MKLLQRAAMILLALLMAFSSLTACQKAAVQESGAETETTAEETPTEEFKSILLSDEDGVYYKVIRPQAATDAVAEWMEDIVTFPTKQSKKLTLSWTGDRTEAVAKEILLGYTNRPESREVMESIGYDDFAIVTKGDKVVVAAHREERLREAVIYLKEHLLSVETDDNGKKSFYYLGDYTYTGNQKYLFGAENPLSEYDIVYREGSEALKAAAEQMQAKIKSTCGEELTVKSDAELETEREIVLGKTNRAISQKYLTGGAYILSSVMINEGKKLLIGGVADTTTVVAAENFLDRYVQERYTYLVNLDANLNESESIYSFSESPAPAEGAEMRIMSFNILCELWDSKAVDVDARMQIVTAILLNYSPDVVGLQEVSDKCYKSLTPLFEGSYAFVDTKTEKGKTNFSPLAYNVEKVTLLEHGVKTLASGNDSRLRVISWGYFERKSDGARFIVANTHWDLTKMPESRTLQAIEMGDFIVEMKAKYNCPAITTGDYNTQDYQEQFQTYLDHSKLSDAGLTAKVINRNYKSTHDLFEEQVPAPDIKAIDHVFYSSDIEALYYNMLIDKTVIDASDHFPVYADIRFK